MSNLPPGLGGGIGRTGPPPGFGNASSLGGRGSGEGQGGTAVIVRAQIVFLLTTFTEESFERASNEIRSVSLVPAVRFIIGRSDHRGRSLLIAR